MLNWIDPRLPGTTLEKERGVPGLPVVEWPSGSQRKLTDFRQRNSVILCLLHENCAPCQDFLSSLSGYQDELQLSDAEVRVVLREPQPSPFPVWVDREERTRQRLLGPSGELPTIIVLDRYATAWEAFPAPDHSFPEAGDVAGTVWQLAIMCPECGD